MKAGDLVLVRNHVFTRWELSIFAYENPYVMGNGKLRYKCMNGTDWNECIPFVGNETLLGTSGTGKEEFSIGQPVAVRNYDDEDWLLRYFKRTVKTKVNALTVEFQYIVTKELPCEDSSLPRLIAPKEETYMQCHLLENVMKGFSEVYARKESES